MKKIIITILGLGLALNAEEIISLDGYLLGATGKNINIRYYTESIDDFYLKYAFGEESLDVLTGSVDYNYNMIGIGYSIFEFYYKLPMNESLSQQYISDKVDGYMGLDLNMDFRGETFLFGFNIGIFNPPTLKYNEYGWTDETDIIGLKMGLTFGYTFGEVNQRQLNKRNKMSGQLLQAFGSASSSSSYHSNSYKSNYQLNNYTPTITPMTFNSNITPSRKNNTYKKYLHKNNSRSKYQSSSGTKYQYDLNNIQDRMDYSLDLDAQMRDSVNPNLSLDRNFGEYGGGSYR